jgi:hypothetical protein
MAHALVFGASGILGWAVVDQILRSYPKRGAFSKVTALTNRPLSLKDSQWPERGENTPELNLVSGIDLTKGTFEEMKLLLKAKVPDIHEISQVFWFGKTTPISEQGVEAHALIQRIFTIQTSLRNKSSTPPCLISALPRQRLYVRIYPM